MENEAPFPPLSLKQLFSSPPCVTAPPQSALTKGRNDGLAPSLLSAHGTPNFNFTGAELQQWVVPHAQSLLRMSVLCAELKSA